MNDYKLLPGKPVANKYDTIQIFRFIAALMVIILHSTYYTYERLNAGITIYNQGAHGVRLFFVISGLVMVLSSENLKGKANGWKIFSIKRIIRIVPIYWIIMTYKLFVLIFASSLVYHTKMDIGYILKSYFFIPALNVDGKLSPLLGVGWTLNFEMFFYLMFTIALAFQINTILLMSLIFIPLSVLSFYSNNTWPDFRFYANPIVLDFLYGMIAGQLILSDKKLPKIIAFPIIFIGLLYLFFPKNDILISSGLYTNENFIIGIVAFLVIYSCASIENMGASKPAWLIYLGGASYSLYLIHPVVAPIVPSLLKVVNLKWSILSVVLSVLFAIAAGTVFYKYCETPITKFFSAWAKKRKLI